VKRKPWLVIIKSTNKEYELAAMHFIKRTVGIYTNEDIRTEYDFKEVKVFHGERELDVTKGEAL